MIRKNKNIEKTVKKVTDPVEKIGKEVINGIGNVAK